MLQQGPLRKNLTEFSGLVWKFRIVMGISSFFRGKERSESRATDIPVITAW